jgi:hypothetical protein
MRELDWFPLGAGIVFGVLSIASFALAHRFGPSRRYDQYGGACILAAASLGLVGGAVLPEHSRWDSWMIGCYIFGMVAALWNFRRARRVRAQSPSPDAVSEIAAPPSNDR